MAWTPPVTDAVSTRVGTEKGRSTSGRSTSGWTPPADEAWTPPASDAPKSFGKRVGETITSAPRKLFEAAKDFGEAGLTMAGNTAAVVAADLQGVARTVEPAFARAFLPRSKDYIAAIPETPSETRDRVLAEQSYTPKREGAKAVLGAVDTVMTPITATSRFVGDVAEGATGSKFAGDLTNDVATVIIGNKVVKAAPKVAGAVVEGTKRAGAAVAEAAPKVVDLSKSAAQTVNKVYTPEVQSAVAVGHLMSGDIAGAAIQGSIAAGRKAYAARKGATPAQDVGSFMSEGQIPGITTKADAAMIRDVVAQRRAEVAARNKASGRNIQSTY